MQHQTLQDKYQHLEVSVLKLSEVKKDNESFRIDSEYFKKEYLENEKRIKSLEYVKLYKLCSFICNGDDCRDYQENGIKYIRTGDIKNYGLDLETSATINPKFEAKTILEIGDLLITRKGNYGKSQVVCNKTMLQCVISSEIFQVKLKDINPFYIDIFLKSKYGQLQFEKHIHGVSNFSVTQEALLNFLIPIFPMPFQLEIENLVKDSHKALESSKALYKEAEALLYEALGLDSKNPLQSILHSHYESLPYHSKQNENSVDAKSNQIPNITIATLKESFIKTGRLDAEYYQSKYDDIERFIKNYGYVTLQDLEIQDKNYTPKQEKQYHYIELANIGSNGNISTPTQDFGKNLPTRARRIVKEGDVIISSVEGSLSSCALITKEFDSCLVSTGCYVLRSKHINGETLLVLFKSEIFQNYLKKFPSGTILSAISKEELQNILIPKIDSTTQTQIAAHIQKSFELRAEAKKLLESAKSKVESALNNANNGGGGGGK